MPDFENKQEPVNKTAVKPGGKHSQQTQDATAKLLSAIGNQAAQQLLGQTTAKAAGPWFLFALLGAAGMEMILNSPATSANATQRVAALEFVAMTLDPADAAAMRDQLRNDKTKIGERFGRLAKASQTRILSRLADSAAKPPAPEPATTVTTPTLTAQQEAEGMRAYYESTRQVRMEARERREATVRGELPQLSADDIYSRWKEDRKVFIDVANSPNHGLSVKQMTMIYRLYWGERAEEGEAKRIAIARKAADADFGQYFENINRFYDGEIDAMGPEFAEAKYDEEMGSLALSGAVDAHEYFIAAEHMNKSLTLDEVTKFVIEQVKLRRMLAAGFEAWAAMRSFSPTRSLPSQRSTLRGSVSGRPTNMASGVIDVPARGSVSGRPTNFASGVIDVPARGSVSGRPANVASGVIDMPGVRPLAKPSVATATRYWWAKSGMKKGNFIDATLENGRLSVTVKSHGTGRRSGTQLFDDVFEHFGDKNIKEFESLWVRDSTFADNYNEFMKNVNAGMSETEAAWNTWTGQQLKTRGFNSVEVPAHEPGIVRPIFRKSR